MTLRTKTYKIVTTSNKTHWGGVFCENGLFLVLEIKTDEKTDAQSYGKKILDTLLIESTENKERSLATIEKLLRIVKDDPKIQGIVIGIQLLDNLYLGSKGMGVALMGRQGKLGKILSSNTKAHGKLEAHDRLLVYSENFKQVIDKHIKERLLGGEISEEESEKIISSITQEEESIGLSALYCSFEEALPQKKVFKPDQLTSEAVNKISQWLANLKKTILNNKEEKQEDKEVTHQKKVLLSIAVLLIMLLFSSVFWNISHTKNKEKEKEFSQALDLVNHLFEEAQSLIELNPGRARQLLSDSKISLSPYLSQFPKNSSESKQINEWLGKISEAEVAAFKIFRLTAVPLFYDLALIKPDGEGNKIVAYKENKAVLDIKNRIIYKFSSLTKQGEIIAGSDFVNDAQAIDIHGKNIYIVNSNGIVEIDTSGKNTKVAIKPDEKWGEISALASYGGNIYLLDKSKHTVWKYILTDFGFSGRSTYLNPDVRVNLSESKKLVIDGSVWVLTQSNILKFSKGLPEVYTLKGFSDTLGEITSFTTDETSNYLYVLDQLLSRILVFDKEGNYYSQYQWEGFKDASDLVVSEAEKKIFVLSKSKIFAIDIK